MLSGLFANMPIMVEHLVNKSYTNQDIETSETFEKGHIFNKYKIYNLRQTRGHNFTLPIKDKEISLTELYNLSSASRHIFDFT